MTASRQLFVVRHAKSSWDEPHLEDHDRPLSPRGRRASKLLARYVHEHGIEPELVLCSSARRTRETLERMAPGGDVLIESDLYEVDAAELIERLRRVPDGTASTMVIGHNPALQMLILQLARRNGERAELAAVRSTFPTGALATLSFDCPWTDLGPGAARLDRLVRPRDLH